MTKFSISAIALCVGGIFLFVTIAAIYATETPVSDAQLVTVVHPGKVEGQGAVAKLVKAAGS